MGNLNTSISSVLFPAFARYQDDYSKLKESLRNSIRVSSYILSPFLVGMAATAKPLITVLLTEKWLPCVPFLQMVCFYQLLIPVSSANLQVIKSTGRGSVLLKLEILKRVVGVLILVVTMQINVFAIAIGAAVSTAFNSIVDALANRKIIRYSLIEQTKDFFGSISISLIMGLCIYPLQFLISLSWVLLLVQVALGGIVFIGLSYFTKNDNFLYLLNVLKGLLKRDKQ